MAAALAVRAERPLGGRKNGFVLVDTVVAAQVRHPAEALSRRQPGAQFRLGPADVLGRMARHHFIHPIRHGARVELPPMQS